MAIIGDLRILTKFMARNCAPSGNMPESIEIPFYHGSMDLPSSDLEGILFTADLQFYDRSDVPEDERQLMGHVIADEIANLCDAQLLPPADRIGVVLAGDFFAIPSLMKRGGEGDVEPIWHHFADNFRWVTGVAGNHDLFGDTDAFPGSMRNRGNMFPLDGPGTEFEIDGLAFAGISGISGNPRKLWRYTDTEFEDSARQLLSIRPDIFVLHHGPTGSQEQMRGSKLVRSEFAKATHQPALMAFGHCHWPSPIDPQFKNSTSSRLNVDASIVLLTRASASVSL